MMNWQTDEPKCETCRWWYSDGTNMGECRRYPPSIPPHFRHGTNGLEWVNGHWPDTRPTDFCGEHQPERKATA